MKRIKPFKRPKPPARLPEVPPDYLAASDSIDLIEQMNLTPSFVLRETMTLSEVVDLRTQSTARDIAAITERVSALSAPIHLSSGDTLTDVQEIAACNCQVEVMYTVDIYEQESVTAVLVAKPDRFTWNELAAESRSVLHLGSR